MNYPNPVRDAILVERNGNGEQSGVQQVRNMYFVLVERRHLHKRAQKVAGYHRNGWLGMTEICNLTENMLKPIGRKRHSNKYMIPIVFKSHFGIFLNLRCILLNFAGLRKMLLVNIIKPTNSIIHINFIFISILNILEQKIDKKNKNIAVKQAKKVHATSRFPNMALSGTKL